MPVRFTPTTAIPMLPPVSAKEFAKFVLPYGKTEGWLCMLKAYFDDSGTHSDSPVVVVGGLLGLTDDWEKLESEWCTKLASPLPGKPPLEAFHLSHCVGHHEEFKDYTFAESEALRHDFRQIILRSNLFQLSLAISRVDWDDLVVPPYRDHMGTAEEGCLLKFIDRSMQIVRQAKNPNLKIAYIYDFGRETDEINELVKIFKNHADDYPEFASFSFGKVAYMPPLQAADTIANENYRAVQSWIADGSLENVGPHFQELLGNMAGEGMVLDREAIQTEIDRRGPDGRLPLRAES